MNNQSCYNCNHMLVCATRLGVQKAIGLHVINVLKTDLEAGDFNKVFTVIGERCKYYEKSKEVKTNEKKDSG